MTRPTKLDDAAITAWLEAHPGWIRDAISIRKTFSLGSYAKNVGLVMQIAMAAEKRDHHPDILLKWGAATIEWTTHDAGGISQLDLTLAETCDTLASAT